MDLIKEKRAVRREWQRTRDINLKPRLNRLTHTIGRELDYLKIKHYRNLLSSIGKNDPGLWKTTNKITKKQEEMPPINYEDRKITKDQDKTEMSANHLESTFTPHINNEYYPFAAQIQNYNENHLRPHTI